MSRGITIVSVLLLLVAPALAGRALAVRMTQTRPWTVKVVPGDASKPSSCRAETSYMLSDALYFSWDVKLDAQPDESTTLTIRLAEPEPQWLAMPGETKQGERVETGLRFWFDDRPMHPMRSVTNLESGEERFELGSDRDFITTLAVSRFCKLETEPGAVTEEKRGRRVKGGNLTVLDLSASAQLAQSLRVCLVGLPRPPAQRPPIPDVSAPEMTALAPPMPERLAAARKAVAAFATPQTEAVAALLQLGHAAADALRLEEARGALEAVLRLVEAGEPLTPAVRLGLERLVEVHLLAQRLDDAFAVAKRLPHNERLLGAVLFMRGDYAGAQKYFCAPATRILGQPVADWNALSFRNNGSERAEAADGISASMRELLLWWGLAALGQETTLISGPCNNCTEAFGPGAPASAIAWHVSKWLDSAMLRDDGADLAVHRRQLGLAAYLRGASLLRAGFLLPVKTELAYAHYELENGSGADGWAGRAAVGLAELTAARRLPGEALAQVREAARDIANTLGTESLPWIEAMALESELTLRLGDKDAALARAGEGLAAARACLPQTHSLTMRLLRARCAALMAFQQWEQAAAAAVEALGYPAVPRVDQARYVSIMKAVEAVEEPELTPSSFPPNLEATRRNQDLQGKQTREQHDILIEALGIPVASGNTPVVARQESLFFLTPLRRIVQSWKQPEAQFGLRLVSQGVFFGELRASSRLPDSLIGGDNNYLHILMDIARGHSLIDNESVLPSGVSAEAGAKIASLGLQMEAYDWLALSRTFPGDRRQALLPGEMFEGLETIFRVLHKLAASADSGVAAVDEALAHAQTVGRGEVLGNLLIRVLLASNPEVNEQHRTEARQAMGGELWLRRERGILLDALGRVGKAAKPRQARAEIRRRFIPLPYYAMHIANLYNSHKHGTPEDWYRGFMNMTWFGGEKYGARVQQYQQRLKDDEAVVIWVPLVNVTELFLIKKNDVKWLELPQGQAELGQQVAAIRDNLQSVRKNNWNPANAPYPAGTANRLYRVLFEPIEDSLADIRHLYTVQGGVIGALPLGLLVCEPPVPGKEPAWLADRFAMTRMPGLLKPDLFDQKPPGKPREEHTLLAAGDPVVRRTKEPAAGGLVTASARSVGDIDDLVPLEETRREMAAVAGLLGLSTAAREESVLAGPQATRSAVLRRLRQGRYRYLLFATHGLTGGADIGEPALVLSPDSGRRTPADDGLLRASDIVGLTLETELVVLSACDTSPSGEDGAEPLAGLASAFLVAGARSVLSTQWPVVSEASEAVSTAMISGFDAGRDRPAEILQRAVAGLRSGGKPESLQRHPVYWAPYEFIAFPR